MDYTDTLLSELDVQSIYCRAVYFNLTSREPQSLDDTVWGWVEEMCMEKGHFEEVPHPIIYVWHEEVMKLINELAETFKPVIVESE